MYGRTIPRTDSRVQAVKDEKRAAQETGCPMCGGRHGNNAFCQADLDDAYAMEGIQ